MQNDRYDKKIFYLLIFIAGILINISGNIFSQKRSTEAIKSTLSSIEESRKTGQIFLYDRKQVPAYKSDATTNCLVIHHEKFIECEESN